MNKRTWIPLLAVLALSVVARGATAATLDDVKKKGFLQCGTNVGLLGFAQPDNAGNWKGYDIDHCRAIAAAIFGDPNAVKFTPLTAPQRFTALQTGDIDLLIRNTTATMSRETTLSLEFGRPSVFGSRRARPRRPALTSNQMMPFGSRVMP